ncbi:MAG: ribonuclease E/G [Lachnospiraceae bacterium]|nr:ribonuclease E/G [Lachnospiraceae bacterium]
MRDYIVTKLTFGGKDFLAAALMEDRKLTFLRLEEAGQPSVVSSVYRGTVLSVAENIGGAFVDIGLDTPAFLPLRKHSHVRPSTPVLVQVTKDASGRKEPVVTDNVHISGKYAVISLKEGRVPVSYSSKLTSSEKELIKKWLGDLEAEIGFGLIIRTNAARAEKAALLGEIDQLSDKMREIKDAYGRAGSGERLWRPEPFYTEALRDLREAPDRVFSDIPRAAEELAPYTSMEAGTDCDREGTIYRSGAGKALSLASLYGLPHELEKLTQKVVWMKSGAFLVIEKTEAFVSIDVNTGRCIKGKIPEETYRKVNLEAAEEIARQLNLRNLSGIILVDFIKMKNEDHRDELVGVMRKLLRKDAVGAEAVDLTPLGIMEIVRRKMRKPLAELLGV